MKSEPELGEGLASFLPLDMEIDLNFPTIAENSSFDFWWSQDNLLHHDCMWTGLCDDDEHKFDEPRSCSSQSVNIPEDVKPPVMEQQVPKPQRSLLKPRLQTINPNTVLPFGDVFLSDKLQTPPMSDDEETKPVVTNSHFDESALDNMLDEDLLNYIKGDNDIELEGLFKTFKTEPQDDDDEDLANMDLISDLIDEEFEEEEEEEEEELVDDSEEGTNESSEDTVQSLTPEEERMLRMRAYRAAASDHSYHKGIINLGVETPSDSEEEIDVVSIGKSFSALPTMPSTKDRHRIQQTMQNRLSSKGAPRKINDSSSSSTSNKSRNARQYKRYQTQRQHKRRNGYGHYSEDEPEPSEKRSLHNNMERQRRIDLRNLFENLKKEIPDLAKRPRAAKVVILKSATEYIHSMHRDKRQMKRTKKELRMRENALKTKLSLLRRQLWAARQAAEDDEESSSS